MKFEKVRGKKGWFKESKRHAKAARGIKTTYLKEYKPKVIMATEMRVSKKGKNIVIYDGRRIVFSISKKKAEAIGRLGLKAALTAYGVPLIPYIDDIVSLL